MEGRKEEQGQKKRKRNSSKVNDSRGLNLFHSKTVPPFHPASYIKPFLYIAGKEAAGAEKGKGDFSKVNDSKGLNLFHSKNVPPFHPASHI